MLLTGLELGPWNVKSDALPVDPPRHPHLVWSHYIYTTAGVRQAPVMIHSLALLTLGLLIIKKREKQEGRASPTFTICL